MAFKLPTFSGGVEKDDLNPQDFVERIETYCQAMKRDPNDECTEMHLALRGNATIWWRTLKRRGINTKIWNDVKAEFLQTYAPTITGQTAHAIGQLEQKGTESVNDYFGRLDQIIEDRRDDVICNLNTSSIQRRRGYKKSYPKVFVHRWIKRIHKNGRAKGNDIIIDGSSERGQQVRIDPKEAEPNQDLHD